MSLQSMTGFARRDGARDGTTWHWELRSVNNRGLDVRLRMPPGYEALEAKVRERLTKAIARGSVNANLSLTRRAQTADISVNQAALDHVLAIAARLAKEIGAETPRAEALLGLKGVLDIADETTDPDALAEEQAAVLESLDAALADLVAARRDEGRRLAEVPDAADRRDRASLPQRRRSRLRAPLKPSARASPNRWHA